MVVLICVVLWIYVRFWYALWAWVEVGVRLNGLFEMHLYVPNSVTDLCALNQVPTILSAYALGLGKVAFAK